MTAFFSSVDDGSELGSPGFHAVVGRIDRKAKSYDVNASIVLDGKRYIVDPVDEIIDLTCTPEMLGLTFHENVLEVVKRYSYTKTSYQGSGSYSGGYGYGPGYHGGRDYANDKPDPKPHVSQYQEKPKPPGPREGSVGLSPNKNIKSAQVAAACERASLIMDRLIADPDGFTALKVLLQDKYKLSFEHKTATEAPPLGA